MKNICKHFRFDDMNDATLVLVKRMARLRSEELRRDKSVASKIDLNSNNWVVRAEPDGSIALLTRPLKP